MRRHLRWITAGLLTFVFLAVYLRAPSHERIFSPEPVMAGEPSLMIWAWETPEDLRELNPARAGVAYLSRELLLGSTMEVRLRHQRLLLPPNVFVIPVVRIETTATFNWSTADISAIAEQIAVALPAPQTGALQIDFDARLSERPFYAELLRDLRRELPRGVALSMTALTSWCGSGGWLRGLPIDEAVPMFFRMGGPASTRAVASRSFANIDEPICAGSAGVSTDELWPSLSSRQRVYLFRNGSWSTKDLALINAGRYTELQSVARRQ